MYLFFWGVSPLLCGIHQEVSITGGTPKWMVYNVYNGFSYRKMDDLGYPYFGQPPHHLPQVSQMARLHQQLGPAVEDHFRLFAALIAGASPPEEGPLPQRGRRIFPAQCWKDLECAKVVAALYLAEIFSFFFLGVFFGCVCWVSRFLGF